MNAALLIVVTVVEIVVLVAVLAVYLVLLARQMRSVAAGLAQVRARVEAIERRFGNLGSAAVDVNSTLEELSGALTDVAMKAEDLPGEAVNGGRPR